MEDESETVSIGTNPFSSQQKGYKILKIDLRYIVFKFTITIQNDKLWNGEEIARWISAYIIPDIQTYNMVWGRKTVKGLQVKHNDKHSHNFK